MLDRSATSENWSSRILRVGVSCIAALPLGLLLVMSSGTGWVFPALLPQRVDGAHWAFFLYGRTGLRSVVLSSILMASLVATCGTAGGLLIGRFLAIYGKHWPRLLVYFPFMLSPMIVGLCLYDLCVRLELAGTWLAAGLAQLVFALSLSGTLFSEQWGADIQRAEQLVLQLGGNRWSVWSHAIFPRLKDLIIISWIQCWLFSWLDFGLVSVIGGGQVRTVTVLLFRSLREANINQAALTSLVLMGPAMVGSGLTLLLWRDTKKLHGSPMEFQ